MSGKILVTGGNGYIGRNLVRFLLENDHFVDTLDVNEKSITNATNYFNCNINRLEELKKIKNEYDLIIHCAGSPSVPMSVENPQKDFSINLEATLNMLQFSRQNNSTFIFLSTVSVFDTKNKLPLIESSERKPTSPYGASKLASEAYCQAYFRSYGLDTRIARIFNTYGPEMKHLFISDMIKKINLSKDDVVIGGSGNQIRDYIFIEDLVQAIYVIYQNGLPGEDYNICSGKLITLKDITEKMLKIMNKENLSIKCDGKNYDGDIEKWYGDPSKINSIGFEQNFNIEEGLKKTLIK
tara:strand:- start:372 stop:1259 length:888 start_codon:yes stop_codon:yes gene_type:complete